MSTSAGRGAQMPPEVKAALGRLFAMMKRSPLPDDAATFHAIRAVVLDAAEGVGHAPIQDHRTNYARDRANGAAGD